MLRFGILLGAMGCGAMPSDGMSVSATVEDASAAFSCGSAQLDQTTWTGSSLWVVCSDRSAANDAVVNLTLTGDTLTAGSYPVGALEGSGISVLSASVQLGGSSTSPGHTFSNYDADSSGTLQLWEDFAAGGALVLTLDVEDADGPVALFEINTTIEGG